MSKSKNVQVEENELRFGIQMQINDLANDMISKLPLEKRNKKSFQQKKKNVTNQTMRS